MKKFVIVIINILLIVGLVACGGKDDSGQVNKPSETSKTSKTSSIGPIRKIAKGIPCSAYVE